MVFPTRVLLAVMPLAALCLDPAGGEESLLRGTQPVAGEGQSQPAQTQPAQAPAGTGALKERQQELSTLQDTLKASEDKRRQLEAEIASIGRDHARLSAALLESTEKTTADERKIGEAEKRLADLKGNEEAIRKSLDSRRDVLAEVLASLQRMGRKPPPAMLVAPEDMLQAIRTSMLLGALLPEMRAETAALTADLTELVKTRRAIEAEKKALDADMASLKDEHLRLAKLIDARQQTLAQTQQALGGEKDRMRELAQKATSLKDLIGAMESEVAAAARAAEAAKAADEARRLAALEPGKQKSDLPKSDTKDPARLTPAIGFADAKGTLSLPAAGQAIKTFGSPDGFGGTEKGLFLETRAQAVVSSPCDGWIVYAGPYRTYGQLLIVNAGQGYYVLLAGMDRINVNVGQFILAGEPVAMMGDGSVKTAAAIAIGAAQPILYVEFRKDGTAVDPGPWWAKSDIQRVRG